MGKFQMWFWDYLFQVIALDNLELFLDDGTKEPRPNATSGNMKVNFNCDEQCPSLCKNKSKFEIHQFDSSGSSSSYILNSSILLECEGGDL